MIYTNEFIYTCCVCGIPLITKKKLDFYHLLGSKMGIYSQYVGICPRCGLIITQNPFSAEQLNDRYKNMSKFEYDSQDYFGGMSEFYKKQCKRQKHFIEENIGRNSYRSILEVGAASGYNLSLYKNKIRKGIEPSIRNCKLAKQNYGISMYNGMWSEYIFQREKEESYDLIFLSMILEHIVNPYQFIKECSMLNSQYIFIEVPTLDYRLRDEPYGMFCEEHVNIFTLHSLKYLMDVAGYSLCNCEMIFDYKVHLPAGYPSIMSIFKKKCDNNYYVENDMYSIDKKLEEYLYASEELLLVIKKRINEIPDDLKIALWGIGHHASMLIANTNLSQKNIVRVYDNDRRKEGLDFCGQKIRPFVLEDAEEATDGILITTYTAASAILSDIEMKGYNGRVYSLYENA